MEQDQDQCLFEAVLNEDYKEVSFLLGIGANPNRLFEEHGGISTFHLAVGLQNDLKFTRLFLNSNASVNIRSQKDNWTPLHVCACWNKYDSLHLLLLNQANPFIQDKNGKTALDVAIEYKSQECVKILRDFIEAKKLKPPSHDHLLSETKKDQFKQVPQQKPSKQFQTDDDNETASSAISLEQVDYVNKSYSNIKTSTFDESNFDYFLSTPPTQSKRTPHHHHHHHNNNNNQRQPQQLNQQQHQHRQAAAAIPPKTPTQSATKNFNSVNELESLISDLIDIKLEQKKSVPQISTPPPAVVPTTSAQSSSSTQQNLSMNKTLTKSNSTANTPQKLLPSPNKLTSATQTRITGKRFYSPEKPPAFLTSPSSSHASTAKQQTTTASTTTIINNHTSNGSSHQRSNSAAATQQRQPLVIQQQQQNQHSPNVSNKPPPSMSVCGNGSVSRTDSKMTQTQGRMVKLRDSGLVVSPKTQQAAQMKPEVLEELNNKLRQTKNSITSTPPLQFARERENTPTASNSNQNMLDNSGSSSLNSKFKGWISKLSSPFLTSPTSATNDEAKNTNQYKFKSSSSFTRLDQAATGTKQQTATMERNSRFKSTSATSLFKHEEKIKKKQTAQVFLKKDQQKASNKQEITRRSSSLVSKKDQAPLYSNPNVGQKLINNQQLNGMLIRDQIGVEFLHGVLGSSELINKNLTPVRIVKRSDSYEYAGIYNQEDDGPIRALAKGFVSEQPETSRNLILRAENTLTSGYHHGQYIDDNDLMTSDFEEDELEVSDDVEDTIRSNEENGELNEALNESRQTIDTYKTAPDNVNDYMDMIETDLKELDFKNEFKKKLSDNDDKSKTTQKEAIIDQRVQNKGYSGELIQEIVSRLDLSTTSDIIECKMNTCFQSPPSQTGASVVWREGNIKSAFNYLLIDPRITNNLPVRGKNLSHREIFKTFVEAIFYIGKGSRARPYAHLYDACRYWKGEKGKGVDAMIADTKMPKRSKKINRILSIWEENQGVVSLHCFQSVIPSEAYTREAAMIDAIGMDHLTNMKKGNYYGESKEWTTKAKRQLGVVLLKKACAIFMAEGERQITPRDL